MQRVLLSFSGIHIRIGDRHSEELSSANAQSGSAPASRNCHGHQQRGSSSVSAKTTADRVSDQAIRVVNVNGEYNVSIGVVHRAKTSGKDAPSGIEHAQITEVYHVIEGNGTLVTGGTLDNQGKFRLRTLSSPCSTAQHRRLRHTRRRESQLAPGDVVIIPPNTTHWFSEITTDQIVYLVVRIDPHKILPAGYVAK